MPSLPSSLPWRFGGYVPPDDLYALRGTALEWVEDHGADGVSLLISQFRGKPRLEALLRGLLAGVQDIEDGIWQTLTERWLSTAEGAQLDGIGDLLGLARAGWPDETYRALLRARVVVLRSSGSWDELVRILDLIGADLSLVSVSRVGMAAARIVLGSVLDPLITPRDVFRLLLERARAHGVRLTFEHVVEPVETSFTLGDEADASEIDAALGLGDSTTPDVGGALAGVFASSTRV